MQPLLLHLNLHIPPLNVLRKICWLYVVWGKTKRRHAFFMPIQSPPTMTLIEPFFVLYNRLKRISLQPIWLLCHLGVLFWVLLPQEVVMQQPSTPFFAAKCNTASGDIIRLGMRRKLIPPVSTISTLPKTVGGSQVGGVLASCGRYWCLVVQPRNFLLDGREAWFL